MTHLTLVGEGADSADSSPEGMRGRGSLSMRGRGSGTPPLCSLCRNPGQTGTHQRGRQAADQSLGSEILKVHLVGIQKGIKISDNSNSLTSDKASSKSQRNEVNREPIPDKVNSARFIEQPCLLSLLHESII